MSAKWSFGSVPIYVADEDIVREVKMAELFKLDNLLSSWHYFGAGSKKFHVKGLVIGETNRAQLESDAINHVSRTFTTAWSSNASMFISGTPKFTAVKYAGGTIDGTAYTADVTPMFDVELEITS